MLMSWFATGFLVLVPSCFEKTALIGVGFRGGGGSDRRFAQLIDLGRQPRVTKYFAFIASLAFILANNWLALIPGLSACTSGL